VSWQACPAICDLDSQSASTCEIRRSKRGTISNVLTHESVPGTSARTYHITARHTCVGGYSIFTVRDAQLSSSGVGSICPSVSNWQGICSFGPNEPNELFSACLLPTLETRHERIGPGLGISMPSLQRMRHVSSRYGAVTYMYSQYYHEMIRHMDFSLP
jgi:hypothetical protein